MAMAGQQWYRNRSAKEQLQKISRASVQERATPARHKCFLSYHSADAEEVLEFVETHSSVFIPKAIGISDDDPFIQSKDTGYVMDRIREEYLTDSTVTIVLVGACTWARKYIDWEVYSTLRRDKNNQLSGLAAIQLQSAAGGGKLPSRVALNVAQGEPSYAKYWVYPRDATAMRSIVQDAFDARTTRNNFIKLGGDRKISNSACP